MVRFGADDDLRGAEIVGADMSGARLRFTRLDDLDALASGRPEPSTEAPT